MRKRLGQHFLVDERIMRRIQQLSEFLPGDTVFEIGCGPGNLTEWLLGKPVVALEKDPFLAKQAQERFLGNPQASIVVGDFLEGDWLGRLPCGGGVQVVGDLPYYASHDIVIKLLEQRDAIASVILVFQREVARRLAASPGSRETGRLSIQWRRFFDSRIDQVLTPAAFRPSPTVHSALLYGTKRPQALYPVRDDEAFARLLQLLFQHRRKTLLSGLRLAGVSLERASNLLDKAGVPHRKRPEELVDVEWRDLAEVYCGPTKEESIP